jgi:hypothetical protein
MRMRWRMMLKRAGAKFCTKIYRYLLPIKGEGWKNAHKKLLFAPSSQIEIKAVCTKYTH